ncbi:MAG TPA: phosphoribosylformylglycinamidine synthase subunit PurS, partial [Geobacteraceae bacterium]
MARRIEIALKENARDARGERIKREIAHTLRLPVEDVRTIDVYTVDAALSDREIELAAGGPFCDPVIQTYSIDRPAADAFTFLVEVGFRPGVTDNVGRTAREAIEYITGRPFQPGEGVYTSVQYLFSGPLSKEDAQRIATELLCNTLIQRFQVLDYAAFRAQGGVAPHVPKVVGESRAEVREIDLNVADDELMRISRERVLALTLEEMKIVRDHYRDPRVLAERVSLGLGGSPTDVELETLAQTWSEHCKHKIFAGTVHYEDEEGRRTEIRSLFDSFIKRTTREVRQQLGDKDFCLSVFKDNAGVIRFDDDWSLVFKV